MIVIKKWLTDLSQNVQSLLTASAAEVAPELSYKKLVDIRTSSTLQERYVFALDMASLSDEGEGGNKRHDDLAAASLVIRNKNYGQRLVISRNELEDNAMHDETLQGMTPGFFAANWARLMGRQAALFPQRLMAKHLTDGETAIGFDGVPFFGAHLVNVGAPSRGSYNNLLSGAASGEYPGACPIDSSISLDVAATNLAKAIAYARTRPGEDGQPAYFKLKYVACGEGLRKRVHELLEHKLFTSGSIENALTNYGIEPLVLREIPVSDLSYYLVFEVVAGVGGPFILQQRQPFTLSTFNDISSAELARQDRYEMIFDGRFGFGYGRPNFIFKCKAS